MNVNGSPINKIKRVGVGYHLSFDVVIDTVPQLQVAVPLALPVFGRVGLLLKT